MSNFKRYGGDFMIDVNALRAEWVKKGLKQKDIAKFIGVTPKTLSLQLKRGILGSDAIEILINKLDIHNPMEIFFTNK